MSRRWVVNASPLILLGKVGQVGLLHELTDELVVPEAVAREVGGRPEGAALIEQVSSFPKARIEGEVPVAPELRAWDLGRGESQVLALTGLVPASRAVLDDLDGRRCAQVLGLPVIGTLGVVLRAKSKGVINAARPLIEHLRRAGLYVSDRLIERVLAHLDE
jgi:predicted nucleic acid-binding protein